MKKEEADPLDKLRGPFLIDAMLRKNGFRIESRSKIHEPTWERNQVVYTQRDALDLLTDDDRTILIRLEKERYQHNG